MDIELARDLADVAIWLDHTHPSERRMLIVQRPSTARRELTHLLVLGQHSQFELDLQPAAQRGLKALGWRFVILRSTAPAGRRLRKGRGPTRSVGRGKRRRAGFPQGSGDSPANEEAVREQRG